MSEPPSIKDIEAGFRAGTSRPYTRNPTTGEVSTEGPEDHARLMDYLRAEERLAKVKVAALTQETALYDAKAIAAKAETRAIEDDTRAQLQASTRPAAGGGVIEEGFSVNQMIALWQTVGTGTIKIETAKTRLGMFEDFAKHFGAERPISAVRKQDVSRWTEYLAKSGPTGKANSKTTRNNKCSHLKELFAAAINRGYYDPNLGNPAEKIEQYAKGEKAKIAEQNGMAPFTDEQLRTIFKPENLAAAEMPHARRAMVIGLYCGARVGEVAQLLLSSFAEQDGILCMKLNGEAKSHISKRLIPVHPDLKKLGLCEWISELQEKGHDRLFPIVNTKGRNKGNAISHSTTNLLKRLGIRADNRGGLNKRVGFHSFRSTVIQALQTDEGEKLGDFSERRRAYVGHARHERQDNSAHHKHYMRAWKPAEVAQLEKRIPWSEWLDFEGLRAVLAESEPNLEAIAKKRNAARQATRARNLEAARLAKSNP